VPRSPHPEQHLTSVDEDDNEDVDEPRDTRVVREESPLNTVDTRETKRSTAPDDGKVRKEVEVLQTDEGY
jgi:hypothetical protein